MEALVVYFTRMFNKLRNTVSEFFNRLPAIILIPAVLLIAFAIAGIFIWAGIELSPVTEKNTGDFFSEKASVQDGQDTTSSSGKIGDDALGQNGEDAGTQGSSSRGAGSGKYNFAEGGTGGSSNGSENGSSGNKSGGSDQSSSSGTNSGDTRGDSSNDTNLNGDLTEINDNAASQVNNQISGSSDQPVNDSDTNQDSSDDEPEEQDESGSQEEEECYHPPGDVRRWWNDATPKQKECYISQHGMPDLGPQVPYFCDYNNSEDCFYR